MKTSTQNPSLILHALEVHDDDGLKRVHLQPGGRYWMAGRDPVHPEHGPANADGVITIRENV